MHRLADALADVTVTYFPPTAVPGVTWTRLNTHYRAAVELARLLLQLRTPELGAGDVATAALTIDMAVLFEAFVRIALREALRASPTQFPGGDACPPLNLDAARRVRLRPDLSYWPAGRCVYVGDVKYKRDTGPGQQSDLYQLLAYTTATQLPRATLVYADGPPSPQIHLVAPPGIHLETRHLDLAEAPSGILAQLGRIARDIEAAAAAAHAQGAAAVTPSRAG